MLTGAAEALVRRRKVVERLRLATEADAAIFYDVVGPPGHRILTNNQVSGDADVIALFRRYEGGPAPQGSALSNDRTTLRERRAGWCLEAPLASSLNRFDDTAHGFARPLVELGHLGIVQHWYAPIEIAQEYRALLYDVGGRFVGWLGMIRRGRRPFRKQQRSAANALLPSLRRSLLEASSLDTLAGNAHLVVDEEGAIEGETAGARRWLTLSRASRIRELVRAARNGGPSGANVEGAKLDLLPLLCASGAPRTLVTLTPDLRARLGPHATLSPRQRQIAGLCSDGASTSQVAATLKVSTNTVKFHLKALYSSLGVSSRVELGRAWREGCGCADED